MDDKNKSTVKVLLLGLFHFDNPGLDTYKPQHHIDILSPHRQQEVAEVVDRLVDFRPTKVAIESRLQQQERMEQHYNRYRQGDFDLPRAEHFQLGFRLAARLEHKRLYCVDAWGRYYEPPVDLEDHSTNRTTQELNDFLVEELDFDPFLDLEIYARQHGQEDVIPTWLEELQRNGKAEDEAKMAHTLREILLLTNRKESLLRNHGIYFNGPFRIGIGNDYPGVDYVMEWYTRNLRIFANIQRITENGDDRILVIFGSGHIPILRHCVRASHEYDLVEVHEYLG